MKKLAVFLAVFFFALPTVSFASSISVSPDPTTQDGVTTFTFVNDYGPDVIAIALFDSTDAPLGFIQQGSPVEGSGSWSGFSSVDCVLSTCFASGITGTWTAYFVYREGSYATECAPGGSKAACGTHALASDTFEVTSGGGGGGGGDSGDGFYASSTRSIIDNPAQDVAMFFALFLAFMWFIVWLMRK